MLFRSILTDSLAFVHCYYCWCEWECTHKHFQVYIWKREKLFFTCLTASTVCVCVYACFWCYRKHHHRFCFLCKPSHSIKINFAKYLLATNLKRRDTLKQRQQSPPLTKPQLKTFQKKILFKRNELDEISCLCFSCFNFLLLYSVAFGIWLPATQNRERISLSRTLIADRIENISNICLCC